MKAIRYEAAGATRWNEFVRESKNGTFLFEREYMDYHADRFHDHSLMFIDERERLAALLPGHEIEDSFVSHGGLTYGGMICGTGMSAPAMLDIFEEACAYLRARGFSRWQYKTVPHIYHRLPAEEDRYALFRIGARCTRMDVLSTVNMAQRPALQQRRRRQVNVAERLGLEVCDSGDYAAFWAILEHNLRTRHNLTPVHTLAEIELLQARFPRNIRLHTCTRGAEVLAGLVMYETDTVAHAQYTAASPEGREVGALDLLTSVLLDRDYAGKRWFDLGASTEDAGRLLNVGLVEQKEGFGARTVVHESYEVQIP